MVLALKPEVNVSALPQQTENQPYLIFNLYGLLYGVEANLVQEIISLPELTPTATASADIVGLLNLRSKILPVMHLARHLGYQPQACQLSDSVIILSRESSQVGIIITQVQEVKQIGSESVERQITSALVGNINSQLITGIAKLDAEIIMLLNTQQLLSLANFNNKQKTYFLENQERLSINSSFYALCCPNATAKEKTVFRERAENLRQSTTNIDSARLVPLVVIGLNGEYFGIALEVVREITNVHNVTSIPCCPGHIIGNMNLRGEIVTLVDIRTRLNLPPATATKASKAIVAHIDDIVAGLSVDEVFDVVYLHPTQVKTVPAALHTGSNKYLRGTAFYTEKMMSIIDLPKLLQEGGLAINEEI